MFFVYVIRSSVKRMMYIGHTENLIKRITEHNSGKTKSIKAFRPFELVYFERFDSRKEAVKREKHLKSGIGREFLKKDIDVYNACVVQLDRIPDFGSGG